MSEVSVRPEAAGAELQAVALRFARRVHLGQHRKQTHEQFVQHPIAVADLLVEAGYNGPVISAAYLHDVVEHTDVRLAELRERFGPEVAGVVDSLSEDPEHRRLRGAQARPEADGSWSRAGTRLSSTLADRVANMRDWRKVAPREQSRRSEKRLGTTLEERLAL